MLQIVLQAENLYIPEPGSWHSPIGRYSIPSGSRPLLASLRQASKDFNRATTPRLFRHIDARVYSAQSSPLQRLLELSKSPYNIYVRKIDFGVYDPMPYDEAAYSRSYFLVAKAYCKNLDKLLPVLLARFPSLKALNLDDATPSLPEDQKVVYRKSVIGALRYVPLPTLTELDLQFLITNSFKQLFHKETNPHSLYIPIEDILLRLEHLYLSVDTWEPSDYPRWEEHWKGKMLVIAELAINVKFLSIQYTKPADIDTLKYHPSIRLRSLYIGGVFISHHVILSLLGQCKETIRFINLSNINLKCGTWHEILLHMCKLPRISWFLVSYCEYLDTGPTPHLRPPGFSDRTDIYSLHPLDLPALGDLQRYVNANRVATGLQPFPKKEYQLIDHPSVEAVMESLGPEGLKGFTTPT